MAQRTFYYTSQIVGYLALIGSMVVIVTSSGFPRTVVIAIAVAWALGIFVLAGIFLVLLLGKSPPGRYDPPSPERWKSARRDWILSLLCIVIIIPVLYLLDAASLGTLVALALLGTAFLSMGVTLREAQDRVRDKSQ